jgi:lysophospholipase L1-like esterase
MTKGKVFATVLKIAAVNAAVLTAGVIVLELVFGNWLNPNRMYRLHVKRNIEYTYPVEGLYDAPFDTAVYRRDRYGFRGEYDDVSGIDILTIGGSTTDQKYLTEGETWQDVMVREFRQRGIAVDIANAGIDGQTSYGHIKNFDWWFPCIKNLGVSYFLFYIGINDLWADHHSPYRGLLDDRMVKGGSESLRTILLENSALYYLYTTIKGVYVSRKIARVWHDKIDYSSVQWTATPLQENHDSLLASSLPRFRRRLEILARKSRALSGEPIFVTQPSRKYRQRGDTIVGTTDSVLFDGVSINGVDVYVMRRLLNDEIEASSEQAGAVFFDAAGDIAWEDSDFYDYIHFTPRGAEKLGRFLSVKLLPLFCDTADTKRSAQ